MCWRNGRARDSQHKSNDSIESHGQSGMHFAPATKHALWGAAHSCRWKKNRNSPNTSAFMVGCVDHPLPPHSSHGNGNISHISYSSTKNAHAICFGRRFVDLSFLHAHLRRTFSIFFWFPIFISIERASSDGLHVRFRKKDNTHIWSVFLVSCFFFRVPFSAIFVHIPT